jgi:hypothetical protein
MDLLSPPYPGDGVNAEVLFLKLRELRDWILYYRDTLNEAVGQEVIPAPIDIPDRRAYLGQPVMTLSYHFVFLRRLREQWDLLVRTYEEVWDCKPCLAQQAMLCQQAAVMLNDAFTPFEHREVRQQELKEKMGRAFEAFQQQFKNFLERAGGEEEEAEA